MSRSMVCFFFLKKKSHFQFLVTISSNILLAYIYFLLSCYYAFILSLSEKHSVLFLLFSLSVSHTI